MCNEVKAMSLQEHFNEAALEKAALCLMNGNILQLREDSFGEYKAVIRDGQGQFPISFHLGLGGYIEGYSCGCCGGEEYCVHMLAAFLAAQLMISYRTSDFQDVYRGIQAAWTRKRLS